MSPDFPEFRPRLPWIGPDLQTLRNRVRVPRNEVIAGARRISIPMSDGSGDQLAASLHGGSDDGQPLFVLIHGLSGSEDSDYIRVTSRNLLQRGARVLRLNLRGAGASRPTCRLQYHAGRTADLRDALNHIRESGIAERFFLVGYSLGGNMLLKFLAEHGDDLDIDGAAAVSAPIDLEAACRRILEPRNYVYQRVLLTAMREESLGHGAEVSEAERSAILAARTIYDFDASFVAPRNGFESAEDYYVRNAAQGFLAEISTPTLVMFALDDPWIPRDAYDRFDWSSNPRLVPLLAPGGGHVGFHAAGSRLPWHDRCLAAFLDAAGPNRS